MKTLTKEQLAHLEQHFKQRHESLLLMARSTGINIDDLEGRDNDDSLKVPDELVEY